MKGLQDISLPTFSVHLQSDLKGKHHKVQEPDQVLQYDALLRVLIFHPDCERVPRKDVS